MSKLGNRVALVTGGSRGIGAAIASVALMFAGTLGGGDLVGNMLALCVANLFGRNTSRRGAARNLDLLPATVFAGVFALVATLPLAQLDAPSAFEFGLLAAKLGLGLILFMRVAPAPYRRSGSTCSLCLR